MKAAQGLITGAALLMAGCAPQFGREEPVERVATISATYDGAPEAVQSGFEAAMAIWSRCLVTEAPIAIHVSWIERGPTGFAFPNAVRNEAHLPVKDVWYPTALANALAGARASEADDMNIFLSGATNWYFGGDEEIAADQTDFINVALHEIAHGLGVSSATFIPWEGGGSASIGLPNAFVSYFDYTFETPALDGTPALYDSKIRLGDGRSILDFPNESAELTEALNDPSLYFDGAAARAANGGAIVRVTPGSITHIPLQAGRPAPIMLADSGQGESIQAPDPILLGMLTDLGWKISERCAAS